MHSAYPACPPDLQPTRCAPTAVRWLSLALLVASLAACVTPPPGSPPAPAPAPVAQEPAPAPAPAPEPPAPPPVAAVTGAEPLREGLAAYQAADYRRAETRLQDALRLGIPTSDQLQAHKTLAFIYCVTRRAPQCEKSFETAFEVAKTANTPFELSRAERGHPQWGPVYSRVLARQSSAAPAAKPAAPTKPAVPRPATPKPTTPASPVKPPAKG
jgi:hypothetical protein